jgi:PAS domain-containing protein
MQRLSDLWEAYLNSGSRHFTTATELKHNRVLNLLYALSFFANVFLIVAELAVFAILLQRDFDRYISYFWPFAAINAVFPLLMGAVLYMKNKYGTFRVTYLSTLFYTVYCTLLSVFLGERIGIHLILLTVMPIVYVMYDFGRWKEISIHTAIMAVGLVTALASYRLSPPVYPIPDDLTTVGGYLCWGAAIALLFGYSTYNWKQVHLTERQLANEKAQTEGLLRETIPRLEIAEAKYRHLVDDSSDMIFQMNETGEILSMNKTAHALLGFAPEEMVGRRLYDFVPDGLEGDIELNRNIVREHVRLFLEEKTLVNFRTTLRKKHMYEPVDLSVTLQKNLIHWQVEILGKASRLQEDVSQRFLEKEKGQYRITNNVTHAEILSQKICERLNRYFSYPVVNTIRICFREILINAIEHGNLGITFDEKTRAIENGDYMDFLISRQKDARFARRGVLVDYLINGKVLMFRVTDEGDGFDHSSFITRAENDEYMAMLEHGRGIIMTRNVFDSVVFNEKGNQVILTKRIPQ